MAALLEQPPPSLVLSTNDGSPQRRQRRETDGSTGSEEDVAAIRALQINVEQDHPATAAAAAPATAAPKNDLKAKTSGTTMSSLRSVLGIPAAKSVSTTTTATSKTPTAASSLAPPPSRNTSGMLGVPPSTSARTAPPGVGGASGASLRVGGNGEDGRQLLTSEIAPKRKKVVLAPGCSALDWARVKGQLAVERSRQPGGGMPRRITMAELKQHKSLESAWSVFHGKVYDMTPYMKFHPGGQQELMRVAGRDGTRLFMLTHSWVNIDAMIDACCIGILVSEN